MLTISSKTIIPYAHKTACLVMPIFSASNLHDYGSLDPLIKTLQQRGDISSKLGEHLLLPHCIEIKAERLLLLGAGDGKTMSRADYLNLLHALTTALEKMKAKDAVLMFDEIHVEGHDADWCAQLAARQIANSGYHFDQLKKDKKTCWLKSVIWHSNDKKHHKSLDKALQTGVTIAHGMVLARDLGNLPGNICTPTYLAEKSRHLAKSNEKNKLSVKVLDEKQMQELKMGALLSVSAGSDQPAKLVLLDYQGGKKNAPPVVLIGKGITFDSGGISLKPGAGMEEMKFDMGGAASVLGVMQALVDLQLPINVVGILACAENMPNGRATKPGDIITSMNGTTIEVINTDAEGRLVLCDALSYAERYKPAVVIDIATLTGACVVALGSHASGLYSNSEELNEHLYSAGQLSEDKAWRMPLWAEYQQQLKSPYADVANVGGRNAGSVTAACFLSRFAEKYPWAHLDIAGTAWNSSGQKGATGRPVPLLMQFLLDYAASSKNTYAKE